jgi:GNAT superfamily N-acetyltransferase
MQNSMLELVERDAWLDLFAAAPADCARKFAIRSHWLGNLALLAGRELPIVEFNRAMGVGILAPATERELDQALAWLQTNAAPGWALQVAPAAQTVTVQDWLRRRDLITSGTGWAKFARGNSPAAAVPKSSIHVRRVGAKSANAFGEVVQEGFGLPFGAATWFAALFGRPGWHLYLAYDGSTPIASGAAFMQGSIAWFGIDTTLPAHRRRGAQTALINRRIEEARALRLTVCTAETGQPLAGQEAAHASFSNYARAGFTRAYVRPNFKLAQP